MDNTTSWDRGIPSLSYQPPLAGRTRPAYAGVLEEWAEARGAMLRSVPSGTGWRRVTITPAHTEAHFARRVAAPGWLCVRIGGFLARGGTGRAGR